MLPACLPPACAEVDDLEGSALLLEEGKVYNLPVLPLDGECRRRQQTGRAACTKGILVHVLKLMHPTRAAWPLQAWCCAPATPYHCV